MANGDETKNTDNEIKIGDELEEIQLEQVIDATTIPPTEEGEEDAPPTEEGEEDAPPTEVVAKKVKKYKKNVIVDIFHNSMITKKVSVPIHNVGKNIRETLETIIASEIEGKCIAEGFVKEKSTRIMTYSCGLVSSNNILFDVVFECMICLPVEGMHITCVAKNITKAGIRAETEDIPSPVVIFVARDHHATMNKYGKVTVGRNIKVRVIGQRFELNDKYISIIAELIDSNVSDNMGLKKKPKKLVFNK
jgi:DNA-directed RNA polymerase subunit E'/Rpb7